MSAAGGAGASHNAAVIRRSTRGIHGYAGKTGETALLERSECHPPHKQKYLKRKRKSQFFYSTLAFAWSMKASSCIVVVADSEPSYGMLMAGTP